MMVTLLSATTAHATLTWALRCRHFWSLTRTAIVFQGAMRLASAVAMFALGASSGFPPAPLSSLPASMMVNTSYIFLGALRTLSPPPHPHKASEAHGSPR